MLTIETSVNGSKTTVTKPFQAPVIKAGEAYHVIQLDADRPNPYTAELSSKIAGKRFYTVTSSAPAFSCVGKMNLPSVPKAAVALAKNANCSIDGIIGRPVAGQIMQPIVRIQYTGAGNYVVGFNASWLVSGQGLPAYPDPKQPAGLQMGGQTIASGQVTSDIYLPRYVTQTSADGKGTAVIRVNGDVGATQYSCSFTVFLPAK